MSYELVPGAGKTLVKLCNLNCFEDVEDVLLVFI
jgi:hypothetical protein